MPSSKRRHCSSGTNQSRQNWRSEGCHMHETKIMAGPENTKVSSHHRGNEDRFLHDDDLECDDDTSIAKDMLKKICLSGIPDDTSDNHSSEDNRSAIEGKASMKRRVSFADTPPQIFPGRDDASGADISRPQQNDSDRDVLDMKTPENMFFVEDDDDDDEADEQVEERLWKSDINVNTRVVVTPSDDDALYSEESDISDNDDDDLAPRSGHSSEQKSPEGSSTRAKSKPVQIELPKVTSGLTTSCRCSNSQLIFRCQISPSDRDSHMPHSFTCPAFSPRWKDVMTSSFRFRPRKTDRPLRRHSSVSSHEEMQKQQQKRREGKKMDANQDWQHQHAPAYRATRSRSYSDTDIQKRLMKEVGRELRRVSDEFHFSYQGRKLTTVSESKDEDGVSVDLHYSSSCPS